MMMRSAWGLLIAAMVSLGAVVAAAPVETNIFAVSGVEVDVTDVNAAAAKNKAIVEAQVKGFRILALRLAGEEAQAKFAKLTEKDVGRMLRSLSIEEERSGPGRYIGKLTVRFLPNRVRDLFAEYGLPYVEDQSPPIVLLPIWKTPQGPVLWEDNPWKKTWVDLKTEQAVVPLIIPLGDLQDTQAITAEEALANNGPKLESIMMRYEASAILVAVAEANPEGGIRGVMIGDTPLGKVTFDKIYTAEDGTMEGALLVAAQRFHGVMIEKWRATRAKLAAEERARKEAERQAALAAQGPQRLAVTVRFRSVGEWSSIKSRIAGTPGVVGVDVASIALSGAVIRVTHKASIQDLQNSLLAGGLSLNQEGGAWVIQPN
jgi:hypothetical protein